MKTLFQNTLFFILAFLTTQLCLAESVIDNPSKRVINLPVDVKDGNVKVTLPSGPSVKPPRLIAACKVNDLQIRVTKEPGILQQSQVRATIKQSKDGVITEKVVPYVLSKKLTKDMLGQYAAAVEIAQALGITEVEYIKVWLADPQLQIQDSKTLVFFYDSDDDVLDRTLIYGNQWLRCNED